MEKEEIALQILLKIMDRQEGSPNSYVHSEVKSEKIHYVLDVDKIAQTFNELIEKLKTEREQKEERLRPSESPLAHRGVR